MVGSEDSPQHFVFFFGNSVLFLEPYESICINIDNICAIDTKILSHILPVITEFEMF